MNDVVGVAGWIAEGVSVVDTFTRLNCQPNQHSDGNGLRIFHLHRQHLGKRNSYKVFHYHVVSTLVARAQFVQLADVGMRVAGRRFAPRSKNSSTNS